MRLTGRTFGLLVGLVAVTLCVSGCRAELEPYTPAGADTRRQPEPLPDRFGAAATVVTDIVFESQRDAVVIAVRTSGAPPRVRAHQRYEPPHVALDIQAARLGTQQSIFASQDAGGTVTKVVTVERFRNLQPQVTLMVHLREAVLFEVEQGEGVIRLALARREADDGAAESPPPAPEVDAASAEPMASETAIEPPLSEAAVEPAEPSSTPSGETISLDVQEADLHDVLRLIADVVGVNIIAGADVQGNVTTRLENVPWDEALDAVLSINGMGHEWSGNVIRVAPLAHFAKQREARLREQAAQQQIQPTFTHVVAISYANATSLQPNLEKLLSDKGSLAVDTRTNTIIVNDTQAVISTITDLVATLDRPTPQIMIESRIVESSRNFLRDLGVQLAGRGTEKINASFPSAVSIFGAGERAGSSVPGNFILDLPAQVGTGAGGSLGISFASIGSSFLDVHLSALEASGRGKVISRPRIATLDNTEALIQSGRRIPFETTSANQGTQTQFADASISLRVTPHVTPHGFINMKIVAARNAADFTRTSRDGVPTIITREATTEMLVRDGDTVVIGGLYTRDMSTSQDGVPFFSNIPVLGWLFRRTRSLDTTDELLFFITPRIIHEPQEGLETLQ